MDQNKSSEFLTTKTRKRKVMKLMGSKSWRYQKTLGCRYIQDKKIDIANRKCHIILQRHNSGKSLYNILFDFSVRYFSLSIILIAFGKSLKVVKAWSLKIFFSTFYHHFNIFSSCIFHSSSFIRSCFGQFTIWNREVHQFSNN